MAQGKRKRIRRGRKGGGKIKITQRARIVEKNDATRVQRADTTIYPRIQGRPPASVGATFKIKIRKK